MSPRRLGRAIEASQFLRPFGRDMDVVENQAYHRLLLMYKGELPVDSLLPRIGRPTLGAGAFGYIAAAAELSRMGYGTPPNRDPRPAVAPVWRAP